MRETTFMGIKVKSFEEVTALKEIFNTRLEENIRSMAGKELLRCFHFFKQNDDNFSKSEFNIPSVLTEKPFIFMGKEVNCYLEAAAIYHELMPKEEPKAYSDARTPKKKEMAIRNIPEVKEYVTSIITLNTQLHKARDYYFDFEKIKSL